MDEQATSKLNVKQRTVNLVYNVMAHTMSNFVLQKTVHILFYFKKTDSKSYAALLENI
jgi:hypothetical protein